MLQPCRRTTCTKTRLFVPEPISATSFPLQPTGGLGFILFSSIICFLSFNVLQEKYAGAIWAIINNFRSIDIHTQLDGETIHSLENGFTIDVGLHGLFDDLQLWFEHTVVSG
jgi:hypothetical protein